MWRRVFWYRHISILEETVYQTIQRNVPQHHNLNIYCHKNLICNIFCTLSCQQITRMINFSLNEVIPLCTYYIMLYLYFRQHNYKLFEITATCFDFNQSSFRCAYEPLLVTICFCAFGIPDGLQFSYAYNVILIYSFRVLGCVCCCLGSLYAYENCKPSGIPNAQKQIVTNKGS